MLRDLGWDVGGTHLPVHFMTTMLAAVLVSWTAQLLAVVGAGSV